MQTASMMPPILESQRQNSILDGLDLSPVISDDTHARKLAILGLPWETKCVAAWL